MDVIEIMQLTRLVLTLINLHVFSLYVIGLISECAIDVAHQRELIDVRHRINIFFKSIKSLSKFSLIFEMT